MQATTDRPPRTMLQNVTRGLSFGALLTFYAGICLGLIPDRAIQRISGISLVLAAGVLWLAALVGFYLCKRRNQAGESMFWAGKSCRLLPVLAIVGIPAWLAFGPGDLFGLGSLGDIYSDFGLTAARNGRFEAAEQFLATALARGSKTHSPSALHAAIGEQYLRRGRLDRALGHLQEAVSLDSGSEPAWRLLGICHLHRKEPREATACLDMARRIEPNDPDLRVALGMLHMASGLPAFAEGEFRKAIELSPQCGDAYCALAVIKARQNRFDEAFHLLEQARKAGGCDAAGTEAAVRKMQDKSSQAAAEGK